MPRLIIRIKNLQERLDKVYFNGIDLIYDNAGGHILDTLLDKINPGGCIIICGTILQYSSNLNKGRVERPRNMLNWLKRVP